MGDYDVMTEFQRFWLGLLKVLRQGFRVCRHGIAEGTGFWYESYTEELWTAELHHVFALEAYSMCRVHFIMCSHWIRYLAIILDMCLMPLAVCAWWLRSEERRVGKECVP